MRGGAAGALLADDLAALARSRWLVTAVVAGALLVVPAAAVAATHHGLGRADSYRQSAASLLLLGGLVVAIALGATFVSLATRRGLAGLLVASGAERVELAIGRLAARTLVLLATLGAWTIALQIGSAAIGRGADLPLAVHAGAMAENHLLVMLAAAAVGTIFGPAVAAIVALVVWVVARSTVELHAAAEHGQLGSLANAARIAYATLPRNVASPMIVAMQSRAQGGPAAPRFEINNVPIPVPAAGPGTVLWTLAWCGLFAVLATRGLERRPL